MLMCCYLQASASFFVNFTPRKDLRESLSRIDGPTGASTSTINSTNTGVVVGSNTVSGTSAGISNSGGKPTEQHGVLILSFATGQSLHLPLLASLATPFLTASSPRLFFGVCHVSQQTEGTLLLLNLTEVSARWSVVHLPSTSKGGGGGRVSAIRVKGFEDSSIEVDDPSVFAISPNSGSLMGPTVSVAAAMAAPPKDLNRWYGTLSSIFVLCTTTHYS